MISYILAVLSHDSCTIGIVKADKEVTKDLLCPLILSEKQLILQDSKNQNLWFNIICSDIESVEILEIINESSD